jgi:PAS domain S-box-containing protein
MVIFIRTMNDEINNKEFYDRVQSKHRLLNHITRPISITIVLLTMLTITAFAWRISSKNVDKRALDRFQFRVKETQTSILKRMLQYEQVLRGGVGLFNSSDSVDRLDWRKYVQTLELDKYYPGIQGLGFTLRIPAQEKEAHIASVRNEGYKKYKIKPDYEREEYHSIVFIEPFSGRNLRAFGFDMFSESNRRQAMERARDSKRPALSGSVKLVQETNRQVQNGFLLYMPVYKKNLPLETVEDRRQALLGFVYSPFRVRDLMEGILVDELNDLSFKIYDNGSASSENLIYSSNIEDSLYSAQFVDTTLITVAGRNWALTFSSRKGFIPAGEIIQPMIIGIGGVIVDIALFYILYTLSRLNARNRLLAERYKTEKDRIDIVLRSTNDVIWDWDFYRNRIKWNENIHYSFGYPLNKLELDPDFWYTHLHPEDRERVIQKIHGLIDAGESFWSDEYRFAKADGSYLYILDRGNVIHDKNGKAIRMLGSMIDITQRKVLEQEQKEFSMQLEKMVERRTKELERSNEDLQRFAHVASHDLKEPVRKIKTFANLIYDEYSEQLGEGKIFLKKVISASDRLKAMIDGVLDYSTLNSSYQQIQEIPLSEIISQVKSDLELLIQEKNATIINDKLPPIEGANVLIYQLFYNLINNALKFSRPNVDPIVEITHRIIQYDKVSFVEILVKDNGIGFSQHQADQIFETFVRLHSKDDYEGTGLGLALCKSIVSRHGGFIRAYGEEGKKAEFVIKLPIKQNKEVI